MKKFVFAFIAIVMALAIAPAALADVLCPNGATGAQTGGDGSGTFTPVSGTLDGTSCGASNTAENMSLANLSGYAKLTWDSTSSGYPASLTLGNLSGVTASVTNSGTGQPFYMLAFTDPGDSYLDTTTTAPGTPGNTPAITDQILLIEFQPSTISGGSMVVNPNTTLFNLYDNQQGFYMLSGQQDVNTLAGWIAADPSLAGDALQQIRIGIGMAGGSGGSESLTVDSANVSQITPEPSSLWLLGTGLLGLAVVVLRKA